MLVPDRMTPMEMFDELVDDALKVSRKIKHLIPEYRRNVLKRTSFPVIFKPIDYLSPRKNNWIIVFRAENKKDADKIAITYVCIADTSHGLHVFMIPVLDGIVSVLMFSPHFFQRYRDRFMNGNNDLKGIELIKHFFSRNSTFSSDDNVEDKRIFNASCEDGVCLGIEKDTDFYILRTFITYEMLRGKQIDTFESLYDTLYDD